MFSLSFQDWMAVVQAVILFLGLGATFLSLSSSKKQAKNISTLDLIIHQRSNKDFICASKTVSDLIKNKSDFNDLSSYFKDSKSNEAQAILTVLNFREFVSVGINEGNIDESMYKKAYYTTVMRDWKNLENTVKALRKNRKAPTLFQDFECLAKRWETEPLKPTCEKKSFLKKM